MAMWTIKHHNAPTTGSHADNNFTIDSVSSDKKSTQSNPVNPDQVENIGSLVTILPPGSVRTWGRLCSAEQGIRSSIAAVRHRSAGVAETEHILVDVLSRRESDAIPLLLKR